MDLVLAYELARTLFAGISAAAAAIGVWQKSRDKGQAAKAFDTKFTQTRESVDSKGAAEELVAIIPPDVIKDLESRADHCWTSYRNVLGGEYLPDEVDSATIAVRACVCRELRRIHKLNGTIPPRWQPQWKLYECG